MGIGYVLAVHLIAADAERNGKSRRDATLLMMGGFVAGLVGARFLHIVMYPGDFSLSNPLEWFALWKGGLVFQGAVLFIIPYFIFSTRRFNIPFWMFMDLMIPHMQLNHAFGRMGCFFRGCCHGIPTSMPWGIRFPKGSPAYLDHCNRFSGFNPAVETWSYPVHPTQLYEATFLLVLWFGLLKLRNRFGIGRGLTLPAYLMAYGAWRFFNEFFRNDNPRILNGLLSTQQGVCILFMAAGAVMFILLMRRKQDNLTEVRPVRELKTQVRKTSKRPR